MSNKVIVVTGGTRGIGFALTSYFLENNCRVVYTGTSENSVGIAKKLFDENYPVENSFGLVADISKYEDCANIIEASVTRYGQVNIFINNAGIDITHLDFIELEPEDLTKIVNVNLTGSLFTAKAALKYFRKVNKGAFYLMEGLGSDGRIQSGMTPYGTTKYAVRYLAKSLAKEQEGSNVVVGTLSPGMVITDLLKNTFNTMSSEQIEKTKKIYNILADTPETVARFLGENILKDQKNGVQIAWLTNQKSFIRFMTARFNKRNLFE